MSTTTVRHNCRHQLDHHMDPAHDAHWFTNHGATEEITRCPICNALLSVALERGELWIMNSARRNAREYLPTENMVDNPALEF